MLEILCSVCPIKILFYLIIILSVLDFAKGLIVSLHLTAVDGFRIFEGTQNNYSVNYTLHLQESVALKGSTITSITICKTVENSDIAVVSLIPLETKEFENGFLGEFMFSTHGQFLGRTHLQLYFILNTDNNISCNSIKREQIIQPADSQNFTYFVISNQSVVLSGPKYEIVVMRIERAIDTAFNVIIILLVIVVNVGMGCKIDLEIVKKTIKRPIAPAIGFFSQFIIMPLISFAAKFVFNFESALALGFFALGCSPGGSASNAYTLLLGGDVSLSITMTFISTVAAFGMIPLWIFSVGRFLYSTTTIKIPYQNIIYSLLGLIFPVGIGLLIKLKKPNWAVILVKISKIFMLIFLVFVLTVGVYANVYIFRFMQFPVLLASALLPYLGFLLGGLVALMFHMSRSHILTIAIETGIQNTGIAIVLLLLSLPHPDSDISIVAPIASALFTPIPLWVAIAVQRIYKCYRSKHMPVKQHDNEQLEFPTVDESIKSSED